MNERKYWCGGSSFNELPELDLTPHQGGYMRDLFFVITSKLRNSQMIAKSLENLPSTEFCKGWGKCVGNSVEFLLGEDTFLR